MLRTEVEISISDSCIHGYKSMRSSKSEQTRATSVKTVTIEGQDKLHMHATYNFICSLGPKRVYGLFYFKLNFVEAKEASFFKSLRVLRN